MNVNSDFHLNIGTNIKCGFQYATINNTILRVKILHSMKNTEGYIQEMLFLILPTPFSTNST